jgi:hypothetical protein
MGGISVALPGTDFITAKFGETCRQRKMNMYFCTTGNNLI